MDKQVITFYRSVKDSLDTVGSGLCMAKWYQTTLHLENGHNHSCHHPRTHQTPVEELKRSPSALHNTEYKKTVRKNMLEGQRPEECRYCWNIEDTVQGENLVSDRVLKSGWEVKYDPDIVQKTVDRGPHADTFPSQLEVSFSTKCNFKCSYCSADVSTRWMNELVKHGDYPTEFPLITLEQIRRDNKMPIPDRAPNPYIDAFWQWWPELVTQLRVFRITGGEPLLHRDMYKVLDYLLEHPQPTLNLAINSNLCIPKKVFDRFVEKTQQLVNSGSIESLTIYTSCEAQGAHAEYIRHGLDYQQWLDNCRVLLSAIPSLKISLMSTYNAMSVLSYIDFLRDIVTLKREYNNRIRIDTVYLANPQCLSIDILTEDFLIHINRQLRYVEMQQSQGWFDDWEYHKITRLRDYFVNRLQGPKKDQSMFRRDFARFVDEHDRRRETDFLASFPEMSDFYNLCKQS